MFPYDPKKRKFETLAVLSCHQCYHALWAEIPKNTQSICYHRLSVLWKSYYRKRCWTFYRLTCNHFTSFNLITVTVSLVAVLLIIICSAGMFKCLKDRYMRGAGEMLAHFRALVIIALCDVPPPPQSTTDKVEIIPICFNASEFSGNISLLINLAILL